MLKMPDQDKPRERLLKYGASTLANYELLSLILRTGTSSQDVTMLAKEVLTHYSHISELQNVDAKELQKINGIGEAKAVAILASLEFGKRILVDKQEKKQVIKQASDIGPKLCSLIGHKKQEHVVIICLDAKNCLLKISEVFVGGLTTCLSHPREVFNLAIKVSAAKIILAHNHPSGSLVPSISDDELTSRMKKCGQLLGIPVVDHLIVTQNEYVSIL